MIKQRDISGMVNTRITVRKAGKAMRKFILMLLLAVMSSNAMAEWTLMEDTKTDAKTYFDPATIEKVGNNSKIWMLLDYKAPFQEGTFKVSSAKYYVEFNCIEEAARLLGMIEYSGSMGHGKHHTGSSDDFPTEWRPVAAYGKLNLFFNLACGKK